MKQKTGIFIPVTLGLLTAFGPFITDFYLPSLPEMQTFFATSPSLMGMSLTTGMLGLALGQIFIGPLSDKYGRKQLLVASMLLFAASSLLCIVTPNIWWFNLIRLLQGFAGAGGVVLAKSIATDMFTGKALADFMALLAAINGVTPILAPIAGGSVADLTSWQGVFCLLMAIGIVLMVCSMRLKETLPADRRSTKSVLRVYGNLFKVFRNRLFTLSMSANMAVFFSFFAYISASPFIFQQQYGLTPLQFSLCFALNALVLCLGSALVPRFRSPHSALRWAGLSILAASALIALCLLFHLSLLFLMPCFFYLMLGVGVMQPVATAVALDSERDNAGAASAIFGASGFLAGSLSSPLVSLGDVMVNTSAIMLSGAVVAVFLTLSLCRLIKRENSGNGKEK